MYQLYWGVLLAHKPVDNVLVKVFLDDVLLDVVADIDFQLGSYPELFLSVVVGVLVGKAQNLAVEEYI